jgi:hypothetical protein
MYVLGSVIVDAAKQLKVAISGDFKANYLENSFWRLEVIKTARPSSNKSSLIGKGLA